MSHVIGPSWKQALVALAFHLQVGIKLAHVVTTYVDNGPNYRVLKSLNAVCNWQKNKLCFTYGVGEKQFRNLFVQATKIKGG